MSDSQARGTTQAENAENKTADSRPSTSTDPTVEQLGPPEIVSQEGSDKGGGQLSVEDSESSAKNDGEHGGNERTGKLASDESDDNIESTGGRDGNGPHDKRPTRADKSQGESDGDISSPNSTPPPRVDEMDRWQYHVDLPEWGKTLHEAAKAVFPNVGTSRYRNVHVLMLKWKDEDPNLPVSYDIPKLQDVFEQIYGFETELWDIPGQDCHTEVNQKIIDFSRLGGNSKEDLKILFYAGHGKITSNRLLSWTSWRNDNTRKCPTVKWSGIQNVLEEAQSDVLLLLDCCNAGIANTDEGRGVTELISACAYNSKANGVGYYSFTQALVLELKALALRSCFSVGDLFSKVYRRSQSRIPDDEFGAERHPAPIHLVLTSDGPYRRSIQLSPRASPRPDDRDSTHVSGTASLPGPALSSDRNPQEGQKVPRLALAIRLRDNIRLRELSIDLFTEWLRSIPIVAEQVRVEAGFESFSTLLIVSIPLSLSGYLPWNSSVVSLGPITSSNLMLTAPFHSNRTPVADKGEVPSAVGRSRGDESPAPPQYMSSTSESTAEPFAASISSAVGDLMEIDNTSGDTQKTPASTSLSLTWKASAHTGDLQRSTSSSSVPKDQVESLFPELGSLQTAGESIETVPKLNTPGDLPPSELLTLVGLDLDQITLPRPDVATENSLASSFAPLEPMEGFRPPLSFLFIVNELPANDDVKSVGSISPRKVHGHYQPLDPAQNSFTQVPGHVYRWRDGTISAATPYNWVEKQMGDPPYANGTIYSNPEPGVVVWPTYYRAATVRYTNHLDKFITTRGDVTTRDTTRSDLRPDDYWQPLSFRYENNISYVDHSGDQQYLAVRQARWVEQLLPNTYASPTKDDNVNGGLAGLLPILIALVAFSCRNRSELYQVLFNHRAWRGDQWVPHKKATGRIERRGIVVTVYLDPENPEGSTMGTIHTLEEGPMPLFR